MTKISKKILPEYFNEILENKKNYELRLADWECVPGDILVLKEWDAVKNKFTGREIEREVTYVGKFDINKLFWSKEDIEKFGIQVISLKTPKTVK